MITTSGRGFTRRQLPAFLAAAAFQVFPYGEPEPKPPAPVEERLQDVEFQVAVASLVLMKHEGYLNSILECWGGCGLFPESGGEV